MRMAVTVVVLVACSLTSSVARADPFVHTAVTTAGTFSCLWTIVCGGQGTSSITFGTGTNTATVTFTGVDISFDVTNQTRPVTLGEFRVEATPGFTFPVHPANPTHPILLFNLTMTQSLPVAARTRKGWFFGPGGGSDLILQRGNGYIETPTGLANYPQIVYNVNPFPFTIGSSLTADVGLVPEPGTMVLLGTGLAGAALARRRRRNAAGPGGAEPSSPA